MPGNVVPLGYVRTEHRAGGGGSRLNEPALGTIQWPRNCWTAADPRPQTHLPAHHNHRPRLPHHDDRGHQRRPGNRHGRHPATCPATAKNRPRPAKILTPRAQATQGTLAGPATRPHRPASGGTRTHGPAPAPRSPPEPGRDNDQQPHHTAPAARRSTRSWIPPPRLRDPASWEPDPGKPPRLTQDPQADQRRYAFQDTLLQEPGW